MFKPTAVWFQSLCYWKPDYLARPAWCTHLSSCSWVPSSATNIIYVLLKLFTQHPYHSPNGCRVFVSRIRQRSTPPEIPSHVTFQVSPDRADEWVSLEWSGTLVLYLDIPLLHPYTDPTAHIYWLQPVRTHTHFPGPNSTQGEGDVQKEITIWQL